MPAGGTAATLFVEAATGEHQPARDELVIRGIDRDKLSAPNLRHAPYCTDPNRTVATRLAALGVETVTIDGVRQAGEDRLWIIAPDASDRALDAQAAASSACLNRNCRNGARCG